VLLNEVSAHPSRKHAPQAKAWGAFVHGWGDAGLRRCPRPRTRDGPPISCWRTVVFEEAVGGLKTVYSGMNRSSRTLPLAPIIETVPFSEFAGRVQKLVATHGGQLSFTDGYTFGAAKSVSLEAGLDTLSAGAWPSGHFSGIVQGLPTPREPAYADERRQDASRRAPPCGIRPPRVRGPGSEPWPRCSAHAGGTGLTGRRLGMPPIRLLGPPHWGCIQSLATGPEW